MLGSSALSLRADAPHARYHPVQRIPPGIEVFRIFGGFHGKNVIDAERLDPSSFALICNQILTSALNAEQNLDRQQSQIFGLIGPPAQIGDGNFPLFTHSGKQVAENLTVQGLRDVVMLESKVLIMAAGFVQEVGTDNAAGRNLREKVQGICEIG